ncbi:hypothetical protein [Micromonospora zhanjiangensis]
MNSRPDNWTTTLITMDLLRGALDLERTERGVLPHRLPARARAQCADGQLAMAEAMPSGVRLVFRTAATAVELDVLPTRTVYRGSHPGRRASTRCWSTGGRSRGRRRPAATSGPST